MNIVETLTNPDTENAQTQLINGVVVATVSNNVDPENLGRVKVNYPWLAENSESDWIKVSTFMAGANRGGYFLPEIEDEVLLIFENGDIDYPYVIGALWNTQDLPPSSNVDGNNNIKKIVSRSGHEVTFNDDGDNGKESLQLKTNSGHLIKLSDETGAEKITLQDNTGNNKIVLDSVQNTINIESSMMLNIKSQAITIEATTSVDIKAGTVLTLNGALIKIN